VGVPRTDRAHYFKGKLRNESVSPLLRHLAKFESLSCWISTLLTWLQDGWQVQMRLGKVLAVLVLAVQGLRYVCSVRIGPVKLN